MSNQGRIRTADCPTCDSLGWVIVESDTGVYVVSCRACEGSGVDFDAVVGGLPGFGSVPAETVESLWQLWQDLGVSG